MLPLSPVNSTKGRRRRVLGCEADVTRTLTAIRVSSPFEEGASCRHRVRCLIVASVSSYQNCAGRLSLVKREWERTLLDQGEIFASGLMCGLQPLRVETGGQW